MPTRIEQLIPGAIVTGPLLPEPVDVLATVPMASAFKLIGRGLRTNQVHQPVLDEGQVAQLSVSPKDAPFDGDAQSLSAAGSDEKRWVDGVLARKKGLGF